MKLVLSFSPWYIHVAEKFSLEIYNSTITHPPENFECEKHTPNHQLYNSIQRISLMIRKKSKSKNPFPKNQNSRPTCLLALPGTGDVFSHRFFTGFSGHNNSSNYIQSKWKNKYGLYVSHGLWWYFVHIDLVWYIWTCIFWHNFFFLNNVLLKTKRQMKNQRTQSIKYGLVQKIDYNFIIIIMQLQ